MHDVNRSNVCMCAIVSKKSRRRSIFMFICPLMVGDVRMRY